MDYSEIWEIIGDSIRGLSADQKGTEVVTHRIDRIASEPRERLYVLESIHSPNQYM